LKIESESEFSFTSSIAMAGSCYIDWSTFIWTGQDEEKPKINGNFKEDPKISNGHFLKFLIQVSNPSTD
jgi:hypothetical protein